MTNKCLYVFKRGSRKGQPCSNACSESSTLCDKHVGKNDTSPSLVMKPYDRHVAEDMLRERIAALPTTVENRNVILRHFYNMKRLEPTSTEYYKNQVFVDNSLAYPWNRVFDIQHLLFETSPKTFLYYVRSCLDREITGMDHVKNEIINIVCKFITNPNSTRNNIALYGPAGVGKSKFMQVLANTLGIPMKTISLGGVKDSAFFLGHSYVYVESGPGKIIQNVIDAKVSNPIICFDELDKVSETDNGKDIYAFLSFLTDYTQNTQFTDHYFYGMKFDLSKVFYVFTFNNIEKIDKILMDRLNIIHVPSPGDDHICRVLQTHCIPEIMANIGIRKHIRMQTSQVKWIIQHFGKSINKDVTSGIREYSRILEKVILHINRDILLEKIGSDTDEITVTDAMLQSYVSDIQPQTQQHLYSHMYI